MKQVKLIDEMRASGQWHYWPGAQHLIRQFGAFVFDPTLAVVEISNVADYIGNHPGAFDRRISQVITCGLPPFDICWMEFSPKAIAALNTWERIGALVVNHDLRKETPGVLAKLANRLGLDGGKHEGALNGATYLVQADFSSKCNGIIGCLHTYAYLLLNDQGEVLPPLLGGSRVEKEILESPDDTQVLGKVAAELMGVVGVACSFMACRNVEIIERAPDAKISKRRERKNKPPLTKYYTLEIEPMRRVLRSEGRSEEVGIQKAMHICRGHFATYTPEKPLFGRVSGRFWIPAHVRGSKDAGQVEKDYKIRITNDNKLTLER